MQAVSVRHATLSLGKREQWYEDIRPSVGGSDFNPLAASGNLEGIHCRVYQSICGHFKQWA